jgi:hypothetical protein
MSTSAQVKAKRFLINRIVDQAKREDVPLTDVEIAMLAFAEASATQKEIEARAVFKRDYDNEKYEAKITKLLRDVYELDKKMDRAEIWEQSLDALSDEDVYLALIVKKAGLREAPPPPRYLPDRRTVQELIPTIALVVAGLIVVFTPLGVNLVPNPILRVVVALCFWVAPLLINKLTDKQIDQ